jgi:hypothetical protein
MANIMGARWQNFKLLGHWIVDDIAVSISPRHQDRMRPLQQSKIVTLSMLKGNNSKEGACTREPDEASIVVLTVIEETDHNLG